MRSKLYADMPEKTLLKVKILSYKSPQRYAVRRTLSAALTEVHKIYPNIELEITEIKDISEMLKYTQVLILPSLMIEERLVCVGRFPKKQEVIKWLQA